jgi:hypothetical protein
VNSPYTGNVASNAVAVVIDERVSIDFVDQAGSTVTVRGTGFSPLSVINLFNTQGTAVVNLGGLDADAMPRIPLTVDSSEELHFAVPAAAESGASFVEALNPPFIPFTSSGDDPDGAFDLVAP